MKIYKEVEQIMQHYNEIKELIAKLSKKIDVAVGLDLSFDFSNANLVELTNEQIKRYKDYFIYCPFPLYQRSVAMRSLSFPHLGTLVSTVRNFNFPTQKEAVSK